MILLTRSKTDTARQAKPTGTYRRDCNLPWRDDENTCVSRESWSRHKPNAETPSWHRVLVGGAKDVNKLVKDVYAAGVTVKVTYLQLFVLCSQRSKGFRHVKCFWVGNIQSFGGSLHACIRQCHKTRGRGGDAGSECKINWRRAASTEPSMASHKDR